MQIGFLLIIQALVFLKISYAIIIYIFRNSNNSHQMYFLYYTVNASMTSPPHTSAERGNSWNLHKTNNLRCDLLFEGDENEINKTLHPSSKRQLLTPEHYINLTKNCDTFKTNRSYIVDSLTQEEENFPIAYTIMMYRDVEQSERLLRSIYRPQNFYCIHIDKKSPDILHKAMCDIAFCFPNVFISPRSIDVQWGGFSVLEQELLCMEYLIRYKWRYVFSLLCKAG